MVPMEDSHFLIVTFPGQGHINPSLQFAKSLARIGVKVTFSTSLSAIRRMTKTPYSLPKGLSIVPFSDGYDNGWIGDASFGAYISSLINLGTQNLEQLIKDQANEGHPITHVVYTMLMSWVGELCHKLKLPSTLLWIQTAAVFDIYYYYFNGYGRIIGDSDDADSIELPGLPLLASRDFPTSLLKSTPDIYNFAVPAVKKHLEILEREENPKILINTFDALEPETLRSIEKFNLVAVGPLIPSAFLDRRDPYDASFGGDLLHSSGDCVEWLDSKNEGSVVYIAFGSYSDIPFKQIEGIAQGLLQSKKPFLWVMRKSSTGEKLDEKLSCKDELEKQGMIVEWCSQLDVLSHPSIGCFMTHCGWNSSMESLVFGVPVFAIPQWTDQPTNAKFLQDVWKTAIRPVANEEGIVEADEIRGGLEIVMDGGERSEELRRNTRKWRDLAIEAAMDGGSSNLNLKAFVNEVGSKLVSSKNCT